MSEHLQDQIVSRAKALFRSVPNGSVMHDAWSVDPLKQGATSSEIFRIKNAERSVILKITGRPDASLADAGDWLREIDAYRCGDLKKLPPGLSAPECYAIDDQPDGAAWLWLEDVQDLQPNWTTIDYDLAARALGRFNGAYLAGWPMPNGAWLSKNWLRTQVEASANFIEPLIRHADHDLIHRTFPHDIIQSMLRWWDVRERYFSVLAQLTETFCHMDAFRHNLFWVASAGESRELVAVDWSFTGMAPVGMELAPLMGGGIASRDILMDECIAYERKAFTAYSNGLRESGWAGADDEIRLGYAISAMLRYNLGVLWFIVPLFLNDRMIDETGKSLNQKLVGTADLWGAFMRKYILRLAYEVQASLGF